MLEAALAYIGLETFLAIGVLTGLVEADKIVEKEKDDFGAHQFREGLMTGWEDKAWPPHLRAAMSKMRVEHQIAYLSGALEGAMDEQREMTPEEDRRNVIYMKARMGGE